MLAGRGGLTLRSRVLRFQYLEIKVSVFLDLKKLKSKSCCILLFHSLRAGRDISDNVIIGNWR
jgi:hypothetical protein